MSTAGQAMVAILSISFISDVLMKRVSCVPQLCGIQAANVSCHGKIFKGNNWRQQRQQSALLANTIKYFLIRRQVIQASSARAGKMFYMENNCLTNGECKWSFASFARFPRVNGLGEMMLFNALILFPVVMLNILMVTCHLTVH